MSTEEAQEPTVTVQTKNSLVEKERKSLTPLLKKEKCEYVKSHLA